MKRKLLNLFSVITLSLFSGNLIGQTNTWDGSSSTSWNTAANWSLGTVPVATDDVVIPGGLTNYPVISGITALTANLTINVGGTFTIDPDGALTVDGDLNIVDFNDLLTINSNASNSGSLIVTGSSIGVGFFAYNRHIPLSSNWFLTSLAFGEQLSVVFLSQNNLAIASGGFPINTASGRNRGIGFYDNGDAPDPWTYVRETVGGRGAQPSFLPNISAGEGFAIRLTASGTLYMEGYALEGSVSKSVTRNAGVNSFNLLGNPYPAYLNSPAFATANTGILQEETVWVSNGSSYSTHNGADPIELAPGQGFFVKVNASGSVNFTRSNQSHQSNDNFGKQEARPTFELFLENSTEKKSTKVFYIENKTTGFDNGYDSSMFEDSNSNISLYTELVTNNQGEKLAIQTLPNGNIENYVVPLGVKAVADNEITFSISASNFNEDIKIFLEDRFTNTFTRLDESNTTYNVTLESNLDGVGRFYVHTTQAALSIDSNQALSGVQVYKMNDNLRITGLTQGNANVLMYNVLGKEVLSTSFSAKGTNDISIPHNISNGVYFVKLETTDGILNKKIILE
jgi:hypothetical protein